MSTSYRYRNGQLLEVGNRTRYDGATVDQPSLVIKSASRQDTGRYSCVLENEIGATESQNAAQLNVLCEFLMATYTTSPDNGPLTTTSSDNWPLDNWVLNNRTAITLT